MVKITIKSNNFKRGPGYWKFNASLLTDDEFLKKMNDLIETHFDEYSNESAITAWETMKFKIKSACIAFSKKRSNTNKSHRHHLITALYAAEKKLARNPDQKKKKKKLKRKTQNLKKTI